MSKIAIISGSLSRGGAERVSLYLADKLRTYHNETVLITTRIAEQEYLLPNGVKRINVVCSSYNVIGRLRKIIKSENPDLILIMGTSNTTYAIPALWGLKKKVVVSERNSPTHFAGRKITKWISRFLLRFADGFVFQTQEVKEFYSILLKGRGVVIPNPLFLNNLIKPYNSDRKLRIVTAGRLVNQKNQALLIKAFSMLLPKFPDYILEIFGEGPNRQKLQLQIQQLGLQSKVFLRGNVEDLFHRIIDASIFVMTSDFEGMPNALIEAMALGIPCISSDCPSGGPRDLICHKVNGMLFPVGNCNELVSCMDYMLSDPKGSRSMGIEATKIRQKLDENLIIKEWNSYFSEILKDTYNH